MRLSLAGRRLVFLISVRCAERGAISVTCVEFGGVLAGCMVGSGILALCVALGRIPGFGVGLGSILSACLGPDRRKARATSLIGSAGAGLRSEERRVGEGG